MKVPSDISGRPARSLLFTKDQPSDKSFNHIPFLNFNTAPSPVSPVKQPVDDPVEGDDTYIHEAVDDMDTIKRGVVSSLSDVDEQVIHMEITKLPEDAAASIISNTENQTAKEINIAPEETVKRRHIRMDISDEL